MNAEREIEPDAGADGVLNWQQYWMREIARAEKEFKPWRDRCKTILARYKQAAKENATGSGSWRRPFPLLWSNIETQKEVIYSRPPQAMVSRRNKKENPVARTATMVLESAVNYAIGSSNMHGALQRVRDDFLLIARGQAWVRYEADYETQEMPVGLDPMTGEVMTQPVETIADERTVTEYLHYKNFLHDPARYWEEVGWVDKISFLTRKQGVERFGEKFKDVPLDHRRDNDESTEDDGSAKATVHEIHSKTHGKVFFIAVSADEPLEILEEPPLKLKDFYPCPKPVFGTLTNDDLVPTPDYAFYQSHDDQINKLTQRIQVLSKSLKMVGFTPGTNNADSGVPAMMEAITGDQDVKIVGVPAWAAFNEKGGGKQLVWLPIMDVVSTIKSCIDTIEVLKAQVFETTGLSDIMRGNTNPNETLGAQNLKSQFGSNRVRPRQAEMVRFARDLCRIHAEIIAEAFQPETLAKMTEEQITPEVMELLRDDAARNFGVDVETDSTIQPNEDLEKQRRSEFGQMLAQVLPVIQNMITTEPETAEMAGEFIKFLVRGFRVGRELEDVIEKTMQRIVQRIAMQKQQMQMQQGGMPAGAPLPPGADPSAMPPGGPMPPQQPPMMQ